MSKRIHTHIGTLHDPVTTSSIPEPANVDLEAGEMTCDLLLLDEIFNSSAKIYFRK